MKKACFFLFLLFPILSFSQDIKDALAESMPADTTPKDTMKLVGVYFSGEATLNRYSNYFYDLLRSKINISPPNIQANGSFTNGNQPPVYSYNKVVFAECLSAGIELQSSRHKWFHQIVAGGYMHAAGQYSFTNFYSYSGVLAEMPYYQAVNDTVHSRFSQSNIFIGYKFQPTFKHLFLSVGAGITVNTTQIKETIIRNGYNNPTVTNLSNKDLYIGFPFETGIGGRFSIGRFTLKPGIYFIPHLIQRYNSYSVALDILYNFKKD